MEITGHRLKLRDIQLKDIETAQYWLHPEREWHKLDGPYYPPAPAEKIPDMMKMWEKRITANNFPDPRSRVAIASENDDEIMGMVSRYWISEETNWTAIGISIWNPDHWGQGYGYEALGLWCEYLFEAFPQFVRLDARTWSGNTGMMKLAEKLGFTREATFRKARIVDDEYYDGLGYGILRDEWSARYSGDFVASLTENHNDRLIC